MNETPADIDRMSLLLDKEHKYLMAIIDTEDYDLVFDNVISRVAAWFLILMESRDKNLIEEQKERIIVEIETMYWSSVLGVVCCEL